MRTTHVESPRLPLPFSLLFYYSALLPLFHSPPLTAEFCSRRPWSSTRSFFFEIRAYPAMKGRNRVSSLLAVRPGWGAWGFAYRITYMPIASRTYLSHHALFKLGPLCGKLSTD